MIDPDYGEMAVSLMARGRFLAESYTIERSCSIRRATAAVAGRLSCRRWKFIRLATEFY